MNENTSSQRNWFPVIVAGLTILLAIAFYAKFNPGELTSWFKSADDQAFTPSAPAVTESEYQAAVVSIFATYDKNQDPKEAFDTLIALHVPGSMQQFHIDCIIALGKLGAGKSADVEDAMARFNALHAQYSWFTL